MTKFYDEHTIGCLSPLVIFNRSAIPLMAWNGYVLKGKSHNVINPYSFVHDFDYSEFSPYKLGLVRKGRKKVLSSDRGGTKTDTKTTEEFEFMVDYDLVNSCYTFDNSSVSNRLVPLFLVVPCRHCDLCHEHSTLELRSRLIAESQCHDCAPLFVTLTYSDKYLPSDGVDKIGIQKFIKRLRYYFGEQLRYYLVSEYGKGDFYFDRRGNYVNGTFRPHYHMILFGVNYRANDAASLSFVCNSIAKAWCADRRSSDIFEPRYFNGRMQECYKNQLGIIDVKPCNSGAFTYIAKYIKKKNNVPRGKNPNFKLFSNKNGIGFGFLTPSLRDYLLNFNGKPFLYRDKFTGKVNEFTLSQYYVKKVLPSLSMSVPCSVRRAIGVIDDCLQNLNSLHYFDVRNLWKRCDEELKQFAPLGFCLTPFRREKSFEYKHAYISLTPVRVPVSWYEDGQILPTFYSLPSRVTENLVNINRAINHIRQCDVDVISALKSQKKLSNYYDFWLKRDKRLNVLSKFIVNRKVVNERI